MVNLFKRQKDTLIVSCLEDVVFLHPPPTSPPASSPPLSREQLAAQEPSSHDPILRGQVTLVTQSSRRARRIRVELVGRCTRHGGDGSHNYEASATLEKSLEIDLQGEKLDAGTHTWDFSFIIPSSTAVGERSNYGTVRHSIRATLHGVGNFRDLTSVPKSIFVIANPAPPGDLPSGLEIDVRHPANELGPIALHVSSPHLTVASLLFMSVTFEDPPEGLKIMSVQAFVRQEFEIHYSASEIPVSHPPVQRKLLFYADSRLHRRPLLDR
ncbi:immunoglobulin E-set domain protein [Rhodotorula toruloides]|uniref:Immunoglobulin E-set domain protein n=1 Tax=Rhodotorula toruloides TaxID=5286 RepID=A0A511KGG3_RHOTO|nr:immunoglobulin E-set domain protein [Rhodotorula toruloides]